MFHISCIGRPFGREYELWKLASNLKNEILNRLLFSSNDGIRTHVIKFLQKLILIHTPSQVPNSYPPSLFFLYLFYLFYFYLFFSQNKGSE